MAAGLALVERNATDVNFPSCQTGRVGQAHRICGDASNQTAPRAARADCGFGSRCRSRHGALIGAFNAVHLDGDCTRILPHLHLGRNAFAQKRRPDQTRQEAARSITTDQGHLAQPLLDAFDSVLCRQGNGCGYGFTEYLLFLCSLFYGTRSISSMFRRPTNYVGSGPVSLLRLGFRARHNGYESDG